MLFFVDIAAIPSCLDAPLPNIAFTLSFSAFFIFYRCQSEGVLKVVRCRSRVHVIQCGLRSHVHLDKAFVIHSLESADRSHTYCVRVRIVHFVVVLRKISHPVLILTHYLVGVEVTHGACHAIRRNIFVWILVMSSTKRHLIIVCHVAHTRFVGS